MIGGNAGISSSLLASGFTTVLFSVGNSGKSKSSDPGNAGISLSSVV